MSSDDSSGSFTSTRIKENTKKSIKFNALPVAESTRVSKIKRKKKSQPTPAQISKITKNESPVIKNYQIISSTPIQNQLTKTVRFGTSSSSGSISKNRKKEKISPVLNDLPGRSILKNSLIYNKWHSDNDTSSGLVISSEIQDNQRHYLVQPDQLNSKDNEDKTVSPVEDEATLVHMLRSLSTTPEKKKVTPKSFRTVQEKLDKKDVKIKKRKESFSQRRNSGGGYYNLAWMSIHSVGKRILKKAYELWSESTDEKISYLTYGDWKRKLKLGEITKTPPLKNKEDEYLIKEEEGSKRTESVKKRRRRHTKIKKEFTFKNIKKEVIREKTVTENKSLELSDDFARINHSNVTLRRYNKNESEFQENISNLLVNDYLSDDHRKLSVVLISTPVKTPFVLPDTSETSSKKMKNIEIIQKIRIHSRKKILIPTSLMKQWKSNIND